MVITIDKESGFCFGVTGAIRKAEEELEKGPLCCLGDIVHNGQEVERLERKGLETIDYDTLRGLRGGRVLLRAHGEPPSTYRIAAANGIEIIDATCPVVKKLQERILLTYRQYPEAQIVIFGKVGHAEVIGLQGQTNNTALIVERKEDVEQIDFSRDIFLFSQTTKSVDEFNTIVAYIRQLLEQKGQADKVRFEWHDTICRNVANRVNKLMAFAREQDVVFFVGGKKSSNAKVLYRHCLEANPNTFFVSSASELPDVLAEHGISVSQLQDAKVGICGATSTPLWLMEQVRNSLLTPIQNLSDDAPNRHE